MTENTKFQVYEQICKDRFDGIEHKQDEILNLLKGNGGRPGLAEEVRGLKKVYKSIVAVISAICVISFTQIVIWIRQKFMGS